MCTLIYMCGFCLNFPFQRISTSILRGMEKTMRNFFFLAYKVFITIVS